MVHTKNQNPMRDSFGRAIDYLRVSVTDRCNLRCVYCMPESGVESLSHQEVLSYEEIIRVVRLLATEGIKKIKLTGGEPLVRKNLSYLVKELYQIPGIQSVTLTTNGLLLKDQFEELYGSGVRLINLSLDAVTSHGYQKLTRFDQYEAVNELFPFLKSYPDVQVKINAVAVKDVNEGELISLVALADTYGFPLRFIELMPIGYGKALRCLSELEVREIIHPLTGDLSPFNTSLGHGPSRYYKGDKLNVPIGFISAVSHSFCESCNRLRLTADGFLKTCLQYNTGVCLKTLLRHGAEDREILTAALTAVKEKPKEHAFSQSNCSPLADTRAMWQTGG